MAKIPRINQGDRPSATYNPTLDTSVANIMGSIGDVAGEALATVTAEEMAERQRLSMALAAKQRIVDESNAGMVELEFEDTNFKTLAQLERDYADTPEVIPQKYTEIMREQAAAIRNREDINDTVKLMAVKGAESILSSGLRQAYSISSNLQTKQVKGNLDRRMNSATNRAAYKRSATEAEQYANAEIERLRPQMVMALGPQGALDAAEKLGKDIAARYAAHAARNNPQQLIEELKSSPFLLAMDDTDHKAAVAAADASYFKINDIRNLDIAKEAFADGETLAAGLGTDEFIGAAAERLKKLRAEYEMARLGRDTEGRRLKPADAKTRAATVKEQIDRVEKLQAMNYKQLDDVKIDDADTMYQLQAQRDKLVEAINDTSEKENIQGLLALQDALEAARDSKRITKASYDKLKKDINFAYQGVVSEESAKWRFLSFWSSERAGNKEIQDQFEGDYAGFSEEVRSRVWLKYVTDIQEAQKSGKVTPAQAIKIAQEAISIKTGMEVPGAFD